ncbi:MAG TPA: hypothetical protein VF398_04465, partial [bacterium]
MAEAFVSLRQPLISGDRTVAQVTQDIYSPLERRPTALWWSAFIASFAVMVVGIVAVSYQVG